MIEERENMKNKKMMSVLSLAILGSSLLAPSVLAAENEGGVYQSNGLVKFVPDTDKTNPVDPLEPEKPVKPIDPTDPENPDKPAEPGTDGPLSIDFASSFDFGANKITSKDEIYYARAQRFNGYDNRPNYVQVTDKRGTNAGWVLKVKQDKQFESDSTVNKELTGAAVTLSNSKVNGLTVTERPKASDVTLTPGEDQLIMSAEVGAGAGTWLDYWGDVEKMTEKDEDGKDVVVDVTKSVTLSVPGKTAKNAKEYRTSFTWSLSDVPATGETETVTP